ncbi:uncharacterized protein LOC113783641 isoform X3 [Coffea eugenioides]|uniref:uncharacterized protein LOC113783641 isoform X3 n=1 Tax=Coffea eugenioides TaxID=49369 RepID=UPI000F61178C|nr:uncharacterized protein LOC113783641 isoform X3 [Coffea eugenioides]
MSALCVQLNINSRGGCLAMAVAQQNSSSSSNSSTTVQLPEEKVEKKKKNSRVLILGGTGRVGGSTAIALSKLSPDLQIIIAGRNRERGAAMVDKLGDDSEFTAVNIDDSKSLEAALVDVDLVLHTAGPFQQAQKCTVLEAAIRTKTAYIDVCDDTSYAYRAKAYMDEAVTAGIPAITTGGIYPGVSNVMAAELVRVAKSESEVKPERLRNLPEVCSAYEILGVPTVSARFGTAPFFWNWGMLAMTNLLPAEFLRDRSKVQQLVQAFDPLVRAVDKFAGERVSMRVDLEGSDGYNRIAIFSHRQLSKSVGNATAAFVLAVLEGSTQPGVWFPEEPQGIAVEAREILLKRASQGTLNFIMNKAPWMIETDPKEIGLGIYV